MKKLTVIVVLGLFACGQSPTKNNQDPNLDTVSAKQVLQPDNPNAQAVTALVSLGDKFLALGNQSEAVEAWSFVLVHDSTNPAAKERLSKIKGPRRISLSQKELDRLTELLRSLDTEKDLCKFSATSAMMETTNLRMLSDTVLLPSIRSTSMMISSGECSGKGAFVFLAKPGRSLAEIKATYGAPTAEALAANGEGHVDYGRFRLIIAKHGIVAAIAFPPLQ